jgi:steroid 5-alpha reductase family enzyme
VIIALFVVSIGINLAMFVPAYIKQTDTLTDISYAVSFGVLNTVGFLLSDKNWQHALIFFLINMWALRIGMYLLKRIKRMKVDHRFDEMRSVPLKFLQFWLLQGITVFVVMLAALLFYKNNYMAGPVFWVGIVISVMGLAIETIADQQKSKFLQNSKNKGKYIDTGLWSRSRHPNYLGEMMMWAGVWVSIFTGLYSGTEVFVALISPLFIIGLISFVSGIPLLEKSADKKWGKSKEYVKYKKDTPVLLPKLW